MKVSSTHRGPDFFILGGMKCGTTSLFNYLAQHSCIAPPREKELHYYDIHRYRGVTLSQYTGWFPERGEAVLSGEGTPFYLSHPRCPEWIHQDFPRARFIIVMRDPVERFWSHYKQYCKYRNFKGLAESLIEKELAVMDSILTSISQDPDYPVDDLKLYSLLLRGRYAEQIERWFQWFSRDRFLFLFTRDLMSQRARVVRQTLEFLELTTTEQLPIDTLHHTQEYDPMPPDLRTFLEQYYAPCDAALATLLNIRLPWTET